MATIFDAIMAGDRAAVEAAVAADKGALTQKDAAGRQPLHLAAEVGSHGLVDLLLGLGAKVAAKVGMRSAVHFAARGGHEALARHLMARGAPLHVKAKKDWTPLHEALQLGRLREAMTLIDLGADATLLGSSFGRTHTPLHLVFRSSHTDFFRAPGLRRRMVEGLLARGASPQALDSEGESPLHVAATEGHAELVALLVDLGGADVEGPDRDGASPLFFAVLGANLATARALLDRGADASRPLPASSPKFAGRTPLDMAVQLRHAHVARLLRERGASGAEGPDPAAAGDAEIHSACWHGDLDDVRRILDADPAAVRSTRSMGMVSATPLHRAATAGHAAVVKLLLERGAEVGAAATFAAYTPLNDAATQGHAEVVRLLAAAGADVNAGAGDRPPLHEAVTWAHAEVVRALLDAGADPNVLDAKGNTPLKKALRDRHPTFGRAEDFDACAELLRARGGHE